MRALARGLPAAGRLIADAVSTQATCSPRVIQVLDNTVAHQYVQSREVKQQATEARLCCNLHAMQYQMGNNARL